MLLDYRGKVFHSDKLFCIETGRTDPWRLYLPPERDGLIVLSIRRATGLCIHEATPQEIESLARQINRPELNDVAQRCRTTKHVVSENAA